MRKARSEPPPLVRPARELRWLAGSWLALGLIVLGADVASGSLTRLSKVELLGTLGLLALSVAGSVAGRTLGVRTPPGALYGRRFDRAPLPPPELQVEDRWSTAYRAGWAAIVIAVMLSIAAPVVVAVVLLLLGTPTDTIPGDLPAAAGLEAAGWILACSAVARQLRRWVAHWEKRRARILLCPPLLSGRLAPVYFAAPAEMPPRDAAVAAPQAGFGGDGSGTG